MSASHPTAPAKPVKPAKPYPDFPLFPHATRRWAKKIRGQLHYSGPWDDADSALATYLEQQDALHAGPKPRQASGGISIKELCNQFLIAKRALVDSGELTNRSWQDYKAACDLIVSQFGKGLLVADLDPEEFVAMRGKMAKKWGPVTLGNVIQRICVVFKFAWDNGLIDRPVRYGQGFKRPSRKVVRIDRAKKGPKLFTADEIRRLLAAAGTAMRAMILLGINGGFGNADCGRLPLSAVDLGVGLIDFPHPDTGIPRRCALWPDTVFWSRVVLLRWPAGARVRRRPIVPVDIVGPTGVVQHFGRAVVDSAADDSVFPLVTARWINVNFRTDTGHRIRWRGQVHPLRFGDVELVLDDGNSVWRWRTVLAFSPALPPGAGQSQERYSSSSSTVPLLG